MSDISEKHVEESLEKIRAIFKRAETRIEAIKPGEKIPATKLAEELAPEFGTTGPALYPVLKYLFNGYPGILIKRGAHGGLERVTPVSPNDSAVTDCQVLAENDSNESFDKEPSPIINT